MARKSTGKRQRFEIFKRDGFKCQYCGKTPAQDVVLDVFRVDHVDPVVEGGSNDPSNLITACFDCNAGKAGIPLDKLKFQPGVDLDKQREHLAQLKMYLAFQKRIAKQKDEGLNLLRAHWEQHVGPLSKEMDNRLSLVARSWPHERVLEAIEITGRKFGVLDSEHDHRGALSRLRYFHAIFRNWREESGDGAGAPPGKSVALQRKQIPENPLKPERSWRAQGVFERLLEESAHLAAIGKNDVFNLYEAFALLAYGEGPDIEAAKCAEEWWDLVSTGYPKRLPVRGLVFVVDKHETKEGSLLWGVEDDSKWSLAKDLTTGLEVFDLARMVDFFYSKGDIKRIKEEMDGYLRWLKEMEAFRKYVEAKSVFVGDDRETPETNLRMIREQLGIPNPPPGRQATAT